ncbi:MAG: AMP-binding protein [Rhodospirillaceae bacterium]|jgi:fatty-acyl-CoA synthase|nr:AMP-binding protein [Rhodospirillaceae bacterium]MBT4490721.1 AMP-binding protein [Rhodospirillaceae bacterium]MBT7756483.1 AMP-binding protein [Rhodospirillaceae bacterium]
MDISHWISHWADWQEERVAVHFEGQDISYGEMDRRVSRLANMLAGQLGVGRGDRVAHLGYNSPELLELLFACARLGAMLVPLNWRLAPPEHVWILQNCEPRAVLAEADFFSHLSSIRHEVPDLPFVAYGKNDGWLSYHELLAGAGDDAGGGGLDDPVTVVYTSGTTGRPKGTLLSQEALLYNAVNAAAAHDITRDDHGLTVLPMFHVGGMNIHTTPSIHAGATTTIKARFDPADTLAAIAERKPSIFLTVPAMTLALAAHPDWLTTDISSLRLVGVGSSAVPEAVLRCFMDRGVPATQIYGLTESAPMAICLPIADVETKIGSCGKPALHTMARIVDDNGELVASGQAGEIMLAGKNLFREYWRDDVGTAEAYSDGWFHTGDIGHQDEDGYYYVDERKKDVVISGGENIYPAELENVLADCADLAEAAVIGRPDERWGEIPVACVVRQADSEIGGAEILALFEGRLARFKHPRGVIFMDALPRNAMGKVEKFTLRAQLDDVEN